MKAFYLIRSFRPALNASSSFLASTHSIARSFHYGSSDNFYLRTDNSGIVWNDMKSVEDAISKAAQCKLQGVTLQNLFQFGQSEDLQKTLLQAARFLHNELPNRLARVVKMIDGLPYGLPQNENVRRVRQWYVESFQQLLTFPVLRDMDAEREFCKMLGVVLDRHSEVLTTMAQGIQAVKKTHDLELGQGLHVFLDKFYTARIGIRSLISQQLALHDPKPGFVGIICTECNPAQVAEAAASEAQYMCKRTYGDCPEIIIKGAVHLTFPYVADHLYYMLLELLKNSCRAVVELHQNQLTMPSVNVIISGGEEDVSVKVSDEGGGIPRSALPLIWSYFYTTAKTDAFLSLTQRQPDHTSPILAGYGFGLPICRLYARYWGGDATVIPMEGYGMDAYLHLSRLGDSNEPLP